MVLTTEHIEKHRKGKYAKVTKRTEGRYEAQEVEFGTVYKWCPECLVVACRCGEKMTLTPSMPTCAGCGTEYAAIVQEWSGAERPEPADETLHPWRYAEDREDVGLPC